MACDDNTALCGWVSDSPKRFRSAQSVEKRLAPGVYSFYSSADGHNYFTLQEFPSDNPVDLPGLPSSYVREQIGLFWDKKKLYQHYNFIHKRGILFYGPPGCGKTSIIRLLCDDIIKIGGIVFSIDNFHSARTCISHFRKCEPERPIMTLMEDVEGIFKGDAGPGQVQAALSFLDGQDQLNNIVNIATTNEPDGLADRFIKRPGRFDLVIGLHAPKAETRRAYLKHVCNGKIEEDTLAEIVDKTEGLGLSYLREIASTFLCLDMPLDETLKRLRKNFDAKKLGDSKPKMGFTIGFED